MVKQSTELFQQLVSEQAEKKSKNAIARALLALEEMKSKELIINFNSLANYANVSKAWLYRCPDIRQKVLTARMVHSSNKRTTDPYKIIVKKDNEINKLKEKINSLHQANKKLKAQLEIAYGELHKEGI